jgi:predicted ferric reductase
MPALELRITTRRRWENVKPGQYVYLRTGLAWPHPFYITRWEEVDNKLKIFLVMDTRRGFPRRLWNSGKYLYDEKSIGKKERFLIEGPYGGQSDLWNLGNGAVTRTQPKYTDIVMIATGMGAVAFLPFIDKTLGREAWVDLFWQIDCKCRIV